MTLDEMLAECRGRVAELMPWELVERLRKNPGLLLLDVREPAEFEAMHIRGSLAVPRGVLESACEWNYDETLPELASARDREVVVVCRSGRRSLLAARTMQQMGYANVASLCTGLRGWNDYEEPLVKPDGSVVEAATADDFFLARVREEQLAPRA